MIFIKITIELYNFLKKLIFVMCLRTPQKYHLKYYADDVPRLLFQKFLLKDIKLGKNDVLHVTVPDVDFVLIVDFLIKTSFNKFE